MDLIGSPNPNFIVPTAPRGDSSNRAANTNFVTTAIASAAFSAAFVASVTASTGLTQTNTTGNVTLFAFLRATSAALGADVNISNTTTYFDGPSVAQGTTGTWFASGSVTCADTGANGQFNVKLWDGTTVIASAREFSPVSSQSYSVHLCGVITNPAGNIRISVNDPVSTGGKIQFNASGNSLDSNITAVRIG